MRTARDLRRELEKISDAFERADQYFSHRAASDAAAHMSVAVRPNPLAVAISAANADLIRLIGELSEEEQ